jgi:hypothetical protein
MTAGYVERVRLRVLDDVESKRQAGRRKMLYQFRSELVDVRRQPGSLTWRNSLASC